MIWRLRSPVRSLIATSPCRCSSTSAPARTSEPLRILFCGSDVFSIASLRAVVDAKRHVPGLIESIDVIHRPAKPTGRGLKTLREVPIKQVATEELNLPTHVIDTFTGWTPPTPIDVVIAVSFGLLVPPRILNYAQYGGLNVHPSLLPDLRGPAPVSHAILKRRQYTGVSVQTLHPRHFDQGTILAQTPMPGYEICLPSEPRPETAQMLEQQLAAAGAEMLVHVLKEQRFVPPHEDVGWYAHSDGPIDHAPKITKQDRFVDFRKHTLADVIAKRNALGDLWCLLPTGDRLIIHDIIPHNPDESQLSTMEPGLFVDSQTKNVLIFKGACGEAGHVLQSTLQGHKKGQGNAKLLSLFGPPANTSVGHDALTSTLHRII
ncbi:methionyl-tRNA formyltransferase [Alternaria rosae]|uniref:methionyl-tRNA formyltransferase n=1 Tax=Alternaria rosae TaxID=1187941 RepID=UPI001E8E4A27|nr:methionyl-tRNA formyltransferase [Alternaria rosae]KAH6875296.1 methionyl-tRNA formyltransferase [Alternaria rosae]